LKPIKFFLKPQADTGKFKKTTSRHREV